MRRLVIVALALMSMSCKVDEAYELSKEGACAEQANAFCAEAANQECESDLCADGGDAYVGQCLTDDSVIPLENQYECLDAIDGMDGCVAPPIECRSWW